MAPSGRPRPPLRRGLAAAAGLALALIVAGCGGHHKPFATGPTTPPTTPVPRAAPTTVTVTTVPGQLPTVPNCGGGAYKPPTLHIVCGIASTMATGVSWQSWNATGAAGTGTVHLSFGGSVKAAPARLALGTVVQGGTGPQFSILTVTWTGPSPDGHPTDTFHLALSGPELSPR